MALPCGCGHGAACDRPGEMGRSERMCRGIAAARAVFECIPPHVPRKDGGCRDRAHVREPAVAALSRARAAARGHSRGHLKLQREEGRAMGAAERRVAGRADDADGAHTRRVDASQLVGR